MIALAISLQVNAAGPLRGLVTLGALLRDASVPNRQIATQLYSWTLRDYDARGALRKDGPWKPLAPRTVTEKLRLGYSPEPLAPRTGNLRQSFAMFSDSNQAGVGARASYGVDYAQTHEQGSGRVPARPMLPPEDVALDYAVRIYQRYLNLGAPGGAAP